MTEEPDRSPAPDGPTAADTSIFRQSALAHYMQGVEAPESAPIRRSKRLRWLWLALAAALVAAAWVSLRPVPAFVDAQIAILEHDCEGQVDALVLVVDDTLGPALEPGRSVLIGHAELGQLRLTLTSVAARGARPEEIPGALGCPVDAGTLPAGRYTVAGARMAREQAVARLAPAVIPAHIEVESRTLLSLLPIWQAPAEGGVPAGGAPAP